MRVRDSNSDHRRIHITRVKNVLDLALKLEEVVLSKGNFLNLQPYGLLNDYLEVLYNFFIFLLILINIAATFYNFKLGLSFRL